MISAYDISSACAVRMPRTVRPCIAASISIERPLGGYSRFTARRRHSSSWGASTCDVHMSHTPPPDNKQTKPHNMSRRAGCGAVHAGDQEEQKSGAPTEPAAGCPRQGAAAITMACGQEEGEEEGEGVCTQDGCTQVGGCSSVGTWPRAAALSPARSTLSTLLNSAWASALTCAMTAMVTPASSHAADQRRATARDEHVPFVRCWLAARTPATTSSDHRARVAQRTHLALQKLLAPSLEPRRRDLSEGPALAALRVDAQRCRLLRGGAVLGGLAHRRVVPVRSRGRSAGRGEAWTPSSHTGSASARQALGSGTPGGGCTQLRGGAAAM
jgi:hypothetical protein